MHKCQQIKHFESLSRQRMLPFTFISVGMNLINQIEFGLVRQTSTKNWEQVLGPASLLNDFPDSYSKGEKKITC